MKRFSLFLSALPVLMAVCTGRAWACSMAFLPYDLTWFILATVLLLVINYLLLYNKRYFAVEGAMVILAGTASLAAHPSIIRFHLINSVVMLLVFATVRLLRRHDLSELLTARHLPLAFSFIVVTAIWYFVTISRPLLVTNCVAETRPMLNMGTALEEYASDHGGKYPRELKETVPEYTKQIPRTAPYLNDRDRAYYEKTYNLKLTIQYEVSSSQDAYTMSMRPWPFPSSKSKDGTYYYNSRSGLET
ncbi:MAG: hypothetical protein AB9903_09665 [Vulcanimicrobiota bacterium]